MIQWPPDTKEGHSEEKTAVIGFSHGVFCFMEKTKENKLEEIESWHDGAYDWISIEQYYYQNHEIEVIRNM